MELLATTAKTECNSLRKAIHWCPCGVICGCAVQCECHYCAMCGCAVHCECHYCAMWDYVGIVRSDLRLERALRRQTFLYEEVEDFYSRTRVTVPLCELRNLISIAYLIILSAMKRKESCGLHYNVDYEEHARGFNP